MNTINPLLMLKSLSKVLTYEALRVVNLKRRSDEKGKINLIKKSILVIVIALK